MPDPETLFPVTHRYTGSSPPWLSQRWGGVLVLCLLLGLAGLVATYRWTAQLWSAAALQAQERHHQRQVQLVEQLERSYNAQAHLLMGLRAHLAPQPSQPQPQKPTSRSPPP